MISHVHRLKNKFLAPKWLLLDIPNLDMIENHWKKQILLSALQFQFNYGTYPIVQISS